MKFLPLILANLGRKKIRTILTIGSFGVALFLFGLLVTIHAPSTRGSTRPEPTGSSSSTRSRSSSRCRSP